MSSKFLREWPTLSTLLSAYASISTMAMLIRTIIKEAIPKRLRDFLDTKFTHFISRYFDSSFTFVIEDRWHAVANETFRAVEIYLPTRIGPTTNRLLVGSDNYSGYTTKRNVPPNCRIDDHFDGIHVEWLLQVDGDSSTRRRERKRFELKCKRSDRDKIEFKYLTFVAETARSITKQEQCLSIYTYNHRYFYWESTAFKHPSTFDTLAMEPELKQTIIHDLESFAHRKCYFDNVGRTWKRGYLLYGPPGTGKSSLVAAIANYMRYDIYDLQLQSVKSDADLRRILTSTTNQSILLIEDIDCSAKVTHDRIKVKEYEDKSDSDTDGEDEAKNKPTLLAQEPSKITLSGLLNFIDGLWSSCGDERIIIFTTNYKEKLDPALLRPGRMDVHIYMGYSTAAIFKKLASSYLGIQHHSLYGRVEELIGSVEVTPAEVAQQLMKQSDEPKVSLEGLIHYLESKQISALEETGLKAVRKTKEGVLTNGKNPKTFHL